MMSLLMPDEARIVIARHVRQHRLHRNMTQEKLAAQSGVSLSVLRKFERTGKISLESLLKIGLILDILDALTAAVKPEPVSFSSMDELLAETPKLPRKKARSK